MSTLPDREAVAIAALKGRSAIVSAVSGRIATTLPGTYPAIRVSLIPASARPVTNTGAPEFQLEFWGSGSDAAAEAQAADLARLVEGEIENLPGTYSAGRVVAAWANGDYFRSNDPTTGRARYIMPTVGLLIQ